MKIQSVAGGGRQDHLMDQMKSDFRNVTQERRDIPPISQVSSERSVNTIKDQANSEILSISEKQLMRVIERAVKAFQGPSTTLEMSVHKETNEVMIKVKNKETGEIIREIPPEKMLDLFAKMREFAGILFEEKV